MASSKVLEWRPISLASARKGCQLGPKKMVALTDPPFEAGLFPTLLRKRDEHIGSSLEDASTIGNPVLLRSRPPACRVLVEVRDKGYRI